MKRTLTGRLGRPLLLLMLVAAIMLTALPALGQTTSEPVEGSAVTAIALVTAVVKLLVDKIRKYVPALDGELVNLLAFGLAYAATFVPEVVIDEPESWVDRATLAIGIAGLTAIFHNFAPADETAEARQAKGV